MLEEYSKKLLESIKEKGLKPIEEISIEEARERAAKLITCPEEEKEFITRVQDFQLENFKIRLYQENVNSPALVFYHGGGLALNSIETHDGLCRLLTKHSGFSVISVDYRLSPEFKYPIPFVDAKEALVWVKKNYKELGINPRRLFLGGDSSGGHLALATALNSEIFLAGLVLFYPVCDYISDAQSYKDYENGYILTTSQMKYFWNCLLDENIPDNSLNIYPIKSNLNLLPPCYIVTAEYDPLKDDAEELAKKLPYNNKSYFRRERGVMHGFVSQYRHIPLGYEEIVNAANWLKMFFI